MPEQNVEIQTTHLAGAGRPLDLAVARRDLQPGDVALSIPEDLVVTLSRIFQDDTVAELLTTGKLSEISVLTLYMMYEKKVGKGSFWYQYIKELDKQRARGVQAVESPLLWSPREVQDLLQGSPVVQAVKERLQGIEKEYKELDTVWFMAGSLFNNYPFDIPTEAFKFELFKQAFAAVQASIVHLQGVPLAKRFALVPLGPPLLSYSSSCKALMTYNSSRKAVELVVDRPYKEGELVQAWCGPQPNSRLLINYGIVDEHNPYDKLQLTITMSNMDPLFPQKRARLQTHSLTSQQTFNLSRTDPLPAMLLPFMRLAYSNTAEQLAKVSFTPPGNPADTEVEQAVLGDLLGHLQRQLKSYRYPLHHDLEVIEDPQATPRQKIAARLLKIEKSILQDAIKRVEDVIAASGKGVQPVNDEKLGGSPNCKIRIG